ncbi:ABC transporter ATP-binding protein [Candidatus Bathyarchaeota archaeon]|nr:MAG: ABC transporter ATP-binding protein [Candidatus Bathyarchaeota archaeon]
MTPILEVYDLWKSYGEIQALRGLTLRVERGEIFGLIGPNGAGKTTTLTIIVGLLSMDRGKIIVDGVDIIKQPYEYKKLIGYVPESISLPEYLTLEEFLIYSGRIRNVPNELIRKRMNYYLKVFELENKRRSLILSLSRGMRQKAAIAAALIHDPELLILDEPLVGIDPVGQHRIKEIFSERIKEGKTIFISTHMLDTAERMCSRVAVIHWGRIVASGDLSTLRGIAREGTDATLEEVFLKLTEESEEFNLWKADNETSS